MSHNRIPNKSEMIGYFLPHIRCNISNMNKHNFIIWIFWRKNDCFGANIRYFWYIVCFVTFRLVDYIHTNFLAYLRTYIQLILTKYVKIAEQNVPYCAWILYVCRSVYVRSTQYQKHVCQFPKIERKREKESRENVSYYVFLQPDHHFVNDWILDHIINTKWYHNIV